MKRVLVVSPHRDDAAFSCAIAIRELANSCEVTLANFFTVSQYAPFGNVAPHRVSELRRNEDLNFAKLAGVTLDDLELVDAPERLGIEVSEISSLRPLDERDRHPVEQIRKHIVSFAPDAILLPLALGDHVDHRIAQVAALAGGCGTLAFYEDLPYAARLPDSAPQIRAKLLNLKLLPRKICASDGDSWKRLCASCYASQIGGETVTEIAEFSRRYKKGERYWLTPSASDWLRELIP